MGDLATRVVKIPSRRLLAISLCSSFQNFTGKNIWITILSLSKTEKEEEIHVLKWPPSQLNTSMEYDLCYSFSPWEWGLFLCLFSRVAKISPMSPVFIHSSEPATATAFSGHGACLDLSPWVIPAQMLLFARLPSLDVSLLFLNFAMCLGAYISFPLNSVTIGYLYTFEKHGL